MKKIFITVGVLASAISFAQVRTNGTVNQNAVGGQTPFLDASSTPDWNTSTNIGKGLVFPRVDLTKLTTIAGPSRTGLTNAPTYYDGMVVYNIATGNSGLGNVAVKPGFYYYENKGTNLNGGTWKPIGGDISTAVSSNIYTADGALTGDRKVTMGDKILSFEGNNGAKYLEVKNASWYPLVVNSTNSQGGGIAIHPNNLENRAEFSVNEKGDIRFYQNGSGDVMFIKKTGTVGGLVGIGNTDPKVRLDVTGGGRFKRIGLASTIEIDTDNGQWGHLDFRRNDVKRWDIGMTNGEETGGEAGSNFFISSFKDDGSFNASGLFINRKTGYTGIGTSNPESGLDVAGEIIARGQNQIDAYFGGDNVPAVPGRPMNDVEIGSVKAGITDVSLYNRADAKAMNLYANDLNAVGNIKSTALAGDGDKIVVANNDGTLTKGVSISNFATSNLYTANGSLTGDRTVDQAGKWLDFNNGGVRITGNDGVYFPLTVNTTSNGGHGGILIQPNGEHAKRIELNTTPEGNFRLWLDKDIMFVKRETGNVGIGTEAPKAKFDVQGGIRASQGYPQGDNTDLGYAFGSDGDTGLFAVADPTNPNIGTGLDLYVNNESRININQQGNVKVTNLAGDGDKIVIANNDGTLTKGVSISNFATSNIYTADGSTNGDRTVSTANGFLTVKGNTWNPLVVNSEIVPGDPANNARGGIAVHPNDMEKRVEFATTKDGDSRIWLDGDRLFIKRATGAVGIGNTDPKAKLDVSGEILARGLDDNQVYIGGDATPATSERTIADIEIGSLKAGVNDVSLYNRTDAKTMNLFANDLNAAGNIKSNTLAGDGDKIVVANNDGTLTKGVSISNFATSNLYTANGVLTSDRVVDQAGKWLTFHNGGVSITGNEGVYFPLTVRTMHSGGHGGIQIEPNGVHEKRIELDGTPEGNFRLWLDGDKIFVNRSAGHVGIGTNTPTQRLDVYGNGKFFHPNQSTIVHLDTSDGMWTHLDFRRNDVKRWDVGMTDTQNYFINSFKDNGDYHHTPFFIDRTTGNIAIHNVDPSEKLDVAGSIKSRDLAGVGNRNVVADANGKLVIGEATSNVRTEPGNTTLTAADNNGYVYLTGAGTVTVPSSLPQGFSCIVVQQGDGQVTIAGNGVTLQTARGTKTRTKFSAVGIIKRTTTEATITGDAVN